MATILDLADTFTSSIEVYTAPPELGGVLTNAGTVVLTIGLPTEPPTVLTPTPVNTSTGKYKYDLLTTLPGRHTFRWVTTSPSTADFDECEVSPADPRFIVSLSKAKRHLNIPTTSTADDEELRGWLGAIVAVIEHKVGPLAARTVTDERHDSGPSLWLREPPVISVTTVTPWLTTGTTYAAADVRLSPESGRVERRDGGYFAGGPFAVTYRAGRVVVAENISQAAVVILKGFWETQRGASGLPLQSADELIALPGMGLVMRHAELLLAPHALAPGIA